MARPPLPRLPLIAVIGATGTGKSQLAVEIAKRYNGEIINGDAVQLYEGLPIITNKITTEEQQGIPHHLLGCIGLQEQTWVVGTFVRRALKAIGEIRSRGRLPILVGGTHFYTQSLLFHDSLLDADSEEESREFYNSKEEKWPILKEPTEVILEELRNVDPVMADRWHPKDRRKIQRSLELYLQTGKKASDIYADSRIRRGAQAKEDTQPDGATMRFSTLFFWVHAETQTLRTRLDKRVEKMVDQGLLQEVETLDAFAREQTAAGNQVDEERGIWISIGYKEFKKYMQALHDGDANEKQLQSLKTLAVGKTQDKTRQYAKRQVSWIRIKLINSLSEANASDRLYLLDGTEIESFTTAVVEPALDLTGRFLRDEELPAPSSLSAVASEMLLKRKYDMAAAPENWIREHCAVCNVTAVTPEQWKQHIQSKAHKKLCSKRRQQERAAEAPS